MREFANINLHNIDFTSLNTLIEVRTKLLRSSNPYTSLTQSLTSETLIEHLRKYLASKNNLQPNPSERLAKVLPYLPKDKQLIGNTDANMSLLILKLVFRQHNYPKDSICQLNYEQRLAAINKLKHKICYHDDWEYAVNQICNALQYKHLSLAREEMQKILEITYRESSYTFKQRAELFSIQMIACIDIIEFIHRNRANEFNETYSSVFKILINTINKFKKLPENLYANNIFFSSSIFKPAQNYRVVPIIETEHPPITARNRLA